MNIVTLRNVSLRYGARILLDGADFGVREGDKLALIGRNGCGKTTLLKVIAGLTEADSGIVERVNALKSAYLPQEVPSDLSGKAYDIVAAGFGREGEIAAMVKGNAASAHHGIDEAGLWKTDAKICELLSRLELDPNLDSAKASAGLKRRMLLGRGLAADPDLLLLDEPTNHLDIDSVLWLEKFLKGYAKTIVFVSHDRSLLRNIANRVVESDRGKLISFDCGFDEFMRRRDELLEARERAECEFDKKLKREEAWLRRGVKARRTRNEGRVRELERLRKIRSERISQPADMSLKLQNADISGQKVLEAKNIELSFGGRKIIDNFCATIWRGDKIGIIGKNGAGKTTLLKILLGELSPDRGSVIRGTNISVAYFDQLRAELDPKMRPFDFVGGGGDFVTVNGEKRNVMGYLQSFLFEPAQILGEIGMLSGGEKNRLMLAKLLAKPANVIVLDEPTNDLDMQTMELLESMLVEFRGTLLLVSHDRTFMDNVVNGAFCFCDGGKIVETAGAYEEWLKLKQRQTKAEKTIPAREKNAPSPARRYKLSNKERAELESIPQKIDELVAEQKRLSEMLSDTEFLIKQSREIEKVNARMQEIERMCDEMLERYTELEERQKKL